MITKAIRDEHQGSTFISLYDETGKLIARSEGSHFQGIINFLHNGVQYFSPGEGAGVYVSFDSFAKFIRQDDSKLVKQLDALGNGLNKTLEYVAAMRSQYDHGLAVPAEKKIIIPGKP